MSKIIAASVIGLTLTFALPAVAADSQACQASWTKLDSKGSGFVMNTDAATEMAAMKADNEKLLVQARSERETILRAAIADLEERLNKKVRKTGAKP